MNHDKKDTNFDKHGLWEITKPIRIYTQLALLFSAIVGITKTLAIVFIAYLISILANDKMAFLGGELSLQQGFCVIVSLVILTFLIDFFAFHLSHIGAFKLEQILRKKLIDHLAKIPLGYIISVGSGSLKKVLLDDVKKIHIFAADSIPVIGKNLAFPVASFIALLIIDYRFALVCASILVLGIAMMSFFMRDSKSNWIEYEKSQSDINKALIEFIQAMPVVRTFDDGTSSFKRYNAALESYRKHLKIWTNSTGISGRIALIILSPLPTLLMVLIAGIIFVQTGSLDFVTLIAVLMISTGMAGSLLPLMSLSNFLKISKASATRIREVLDLPALATTTDYETPTQFDVIFDKVSFKYNETSPYALKNISFTVPQNTATALVGPSGAGKSTVAKLVPRFWDVTEGSIKIGGVDIRKIEPNQLMEIVSFVFQDTFLFNDSLANNIRMARKNASDEEVQEAAKAAQIHDFIVSLPEGYQTIAGDRGAKLSGGQKQRITIARAFLRNAPILVLDEATSFADPENEEKIIQAMTKLTKNRTVIFITHRLSTSKEVPQILVFDEGSIVEAGNHETLIHNQSTYYKLWSNFENAQNWDMHRKGDLA